MIFFKANTFKFRFQKDKVHHMLCIWSVLKPILGLEGSRVQIKLNDQMLQP